MTNPRIAIGGFLHETHSFAPLPTRWEDFLRPGGWPPVVRGAALIDALRDTSVPAAGAIHAAEGQGVTLVPLTWCMASPAGPIEDTAFETIAGMIVEDLRNAGPLDGLYLDLHGAALAVSSPDAEGELLRRVREVVGPGLPITISLDPHANMTAEMVDRSDAAAPFRTYPHVDMRDAGGRAMTLLLERIRRGAPYAKAFRALDYLTPINSQCTMFGPMADAMAVRERIARDTGVAELAFCFAFPYADFPGCQPAIAAYAADQASADRAADQFAAYLTQHESDFRLDAVPAAEAVAEALRIARTAKRPVVLADTQDNPGGGGHGDTTGLLAELVAQKAEGAVLGLINDAESAAALHAAGEGATIPLDLGGKSFGSPLKVQAKVLRLSDGRFTCTGPMAKGNRADLGPSALIGIEGGVRVIVTSRKIQASDQELFRHLGVEPAECPVIALKSSVHFRAHFQPIAEKVIVALAPGPVIADPSTLPFRNLRPGLRLKPRAG